MVGKGGPEVNLDEYYDNLRLDAFKDLPAEMRSVAEPALNLDPLFDSFLWLLARGLAAFQLLPLSR